MNNPYSTQMVQDVIGKVINEVAGVGLESMHPDSVLSTDLGLESLDFVDLVYRLQLKLGIQLPHKSLIEHSQELLAPGLLYSNELGLTEMGVFFLQESLNRYQPDEIFAGMKKYEILNATQISHWANLCVGILDMLPEICPECAGSQAKIIAGGKVGCAGCGVVLRPVSGDEAVQRGMPIILERWNLISANPVTA